MTTTDDTRLDALDRRGRAAARTLRDDLAARAERSEPTVIALDRPAEREAGRPAHGRLLAVAVAAALVALGGAIAVATRDDPRPAVSSGGQLVHLLPGWLPPGLEPVSAIGIPDFAANGFPADIAVYGDGNSDDPWSATVAVIHLVADEELAGSAPSGGEAVTVAGHEARLREADEFGDGWPHPGLEVEWQVDDGRLIVSGELTREELLAAAEMATTEPSIETSGLPDGYQELARGPFMDSLLFTSLFEGIVERSVGGSGLAVAYADPSARGMVRPAIVVAQRPGPAAAVDLLRMWFPDADAATVRGHHAVIGRGSEPPGSAGETGVASVQWAEPEGQLLTVVGFGVPEDAVLQVAEGLRPAAAGEVTALRAEGVVAAPREFDEASEGYAVVASGESQTGRWRVVADTRRRDNIGSLGVERMWGVIGSTVSTTGDRVEPPLDLGADTSDGTIVVWGVLWVDAATVTVEAPGREPVTLATHEVEGWSHRVVAGSFPDDHFAPTDEVSVIARDADGREVGRSTVLGPDG